MKLADPGSANKPFSLLLYAALLVTPMLGVQLANAQSPPVNTHNPTPFEPIGWGQTCDQTVAIAHFRGDIYAYHGNDDHGRIWYSVNGGAPRVIGGTTETVFSPALTVLDDNLYIFHTGIDGQIYYDTLSAQNTFDANWRRVPGIGEDTGGHTVVGTPAVTSSNHFIVIAATFDDGQMRWESMLSTGQTFNWNVIPGNGITRFPPALVALDDNDVMAIHTGTDAHMYTNIATFNLGEFFWEHSWTPEPGHGQGISAPTATVLAFGDELYIGVAGLNGHPWGELLDYHSETDDFNFTIDPFGVWAAQTNGGQDTVAGNGAPSMAYLQGNGNQFDTNPTIVVSQRPTGLIVRKQLN